MADSSHIDRSGNARMMDTSAKHDSVRSATASVRVQLNQDSVRAIAADETAKGNVLAVAKVAGIQAAKRVPELIPLCHQVPLDHVEIEFALDENSNSLTITATARCTAKTGVEMEALTACSVAALTVYDMLKSVQRDIVISDLTLLEKKGGRSGDYRRDSL